MDGQLDSVKSIGLSNLGVVKFKSKSFSNDKSSATKN